MERVSVHRADLVISPSQALIDLNRLSGGYLHPGQGAVVVRNPIDRARLHNPGGGRPEGKGYIVFVGRIEERKGVRALIKAMLRVWQENPHVKLVMVGSDTGLGETLLQTLPSAYRKQVVMTGFIPRDRLACYYANAAVCVLPSQWENLPYTCLEAMASNTVVVASKNGGMSEIIEDGISGFLVSPEDTQSISDCVLRLLNDKDLRERMGKNARSTVRERFDTKTVVDHTIRMYHHAISAWEKTRGMRKT
jgi:glycosyltransferase involved in cell wall biosynthesis